MLMTTVVALATALSPSAADPNPRAAAIRSGYSKHEFRIPMRDGTRLFTSVYVPADASSAKKYPVYLVRTPYGAGPYGASRYRDRLGPTEAWEKEGFIFAVQDVRGRGMSGGDFVNMRPQVPAGTRRSPAQVDESTDAYDTVDWLVKNVPHNNGRVGQGGISYPGFYASAAAIDSHPALRCVSPQAPIADWYWDDMHRHGAFNLQLAFNFFAAFGRVRPGPTDDEEWKGFEHGTPDAWSWFLGLGPLSNAPSRFKEPVPFWNEMAAHPDYDAYWQARNLLPHLKNVKAAVMVVGGWFDAEDLYGPLQTYKAIEQQNPRATNTLVMGPWSHGGWHRTDGSALGDAEFGFRTSETFQPLELAFFRQHLKDAPSAGLPEAMVFETGANRWRNLDAWPPRNTRPVAFHLRADGALSTDAPTDATDAHDAFVSDPRRPVPYTAVVTPGLHKGFMGEDQRFASRRPDVLVFSTPPLDKDLTVAGPLEVELHVSTTGTDADWVVKLVDENPGRMPGFTKEKEHAGEKDRGGQQTLVRGEPFRGRYRASYSVAQPFTPGEVTRVKFTMNDVFHTFARGHRVMVQVQSSWFPFVDRNPQTFVPIFQARDADFQVATHRVYRSAAHPSLVRLPVLPALDE